jgi:hypothetical protein
MTSTLPNFPANTAAPAPGSKSISPADLKSAGAPPSAHEGAFDELMPSPKEKAPDKPVENSASSPSSIQAMCVKEADQVVATEAVDQASEDSTKEVSPETLEQAAAFVAGLMQTLLPEVTVPALNGSAPANAMATATARRDAGPPEGQTVGSAGPSVPGSMDQVATAPEASAESFQIACAADGAVEIKLELPQAKNAEGQVDNSATQVEIKAELELPGQAVMRLEANASFSPDGESQNGQANFAAKKGRAKTGVDSLESPGERNFVSTADERVKTRSSADGISVAKPEATMPSATLDETRAPSSQVTHVGLPARGEFAVAWPAAEKTAEAVAASVENNFAERAVATVTGLADAQFSASMQKSGSVQLKLKFGGEDLSVRVELRGGIVHTDFRTDSAELRAALTREMQAVASASPEQLRRYAEPVFSPSTSGDSQQQQHSGRQSAAQQDLSQRTPRQPQAEEAAPFARRSLLRETFFPEPAAPRVPALLPTSLRLSALA